MSGLKRGSVAVVGVAESDLGQVAPDTSPLDLMAQGTFRALEDCGLKLADIDGVFCAAGLIAFCRCFQSSGWISSRMLSTVTLKLAGSTPKIRY